MTNGIKCITLRFVKGINPFDNRGPGDSDSLLHSLSSGPWDPAFLQFRMPVSFSPFLPFWAFEKYRRQRRYFFYKNPPGDRGWDSNIFLNKHIWIIIMLPMYLRYPYLSIHRQVCRRSKSLSKCKDFSMCNFSLRFRNRQLH